MRAPVVLHAGPGVSSVTKLSRHVRDVQDQKGCVWDMILSFQSPIHSRG